jgi:hypothetical protein
MYHLIETPDIDKSSTILNEKLKDLSFKCSNCCLLVASTGGLLRITVKITRIQKTPTSPTSLVTATGLFFNDPTCLSGVTDGTDSRFFKLAALRPAEYPIETYEQDLNCLRCGLYIGYKLVDKKGKLLQLINRPSYKLWFFCNYEKEDEKEAVHHAKCRLGSSLSFVDESKWENMKPILEKLKESEPVKINSKPTGLEDTRDLTNPSDRNNSTESIREEMLDINRACEEGHFFMRSISQEEEDIHNKGITARDCSADITPLEHVVGERKSQYISLSNDFSVVLPWVLPFGRSIIVVPKWALSTGTDIIIPEELKKLISNNNRAQNLVELSKEFLAKLFIDPKAIEPIANDVIDITGPSFSLDIIDDGNFPKNVDELNSLRVMKIPPVDGGLVPDFPLSSRINPAQKLQPHPKRTAEDYFARRSVIALGKPNHTVPSYLLVRMTPNAISVPTRGNVNTFTVFESQSESLKTRLAAGGKQLKNARDVVCSSGKVNIPVAYYELTVKLKQEDRLVFSSLSRFLVQNVPILLIQWRPDALITAKLICDAKSKDIANLL